MLHKQAKVVALNRLVLDNLPYQPGQKVEVVVYAKDEMSSRMAKWRTLLNETQALPQTGQITDDEIEAEIEAFWEGS
jgi:hypothetical protein